VKRKLKTRDILRTQLTQDERVVLLEKVRKMSRAWAAKTTNRNLGK